ncbi:hypothetical protein HU200_050470 [Digitaria exilis]|uniref:DUF1618 domain-containing protein n=1 Tax=Digitaria exilis TaxID=1010633 RepID=A0A835E8Z7_9POAL|nr:hypothetical protein HU200_050470 [Digitaria exilis]
MSNAAASSAIAFSGFPTWVFLHSFASFGERRNHTTASCLTSAKRPVEVSFELADPPGISRWFVHCAGLRKKPGFNGPPYILHASGAFLVMRMQFFRGGFDYFVYRAGPGKPSLDLIPWPWPTGGLHKRIGILPSSDGTSYSVVFLVPRFKPPRVVYEIPVFSSENQSWSTKVASISVDLETTSYGLIVHDPSKAVAVGWSSMAWIDLWWGVLLCDGLDQDAPVLRLIKWPVPSPPKDVADLYSPEASRDASLSDGAIRFIEMTFYYDGHTHYSRDAVDIGWTGTIWKRSYSSKEWD